MPNFAVDLVLSAYVSAGSAQEAQEKLAQEVHNRMDDARRSMREVDIEYAEVQYHTVKATNLPWPRPVA